MLEVILIGGTIVDRSRMAAATSTRAGTVRFSAVDGSPAALEEMGRSAGPNVQQLVVIDLALDTWAAILAALNAQHHPGICHVAVLVGVADTERLAAARRLRVTSLLLKPINSEHVSMLAKELHLDWPQ